MQHRTVLLGITLSLSFFNAGAQAQLLAHYPFNEAPGATVAVPSFGSVNGNLQGGAAFVAGGIAGNAVSLTNPVNNSVESVVDMGNNFGFLTGNYSIAFWIKTSTSDADTAAVAKHAAGSQNGYLFPVGPTGGGGAAGKANFTASTTISNGVTSTTTVNDNVWHHIVGVYNAPVGTHSIYVDGAPAEQTKATAAMVNSAAAFYVGGVGRIGNPADADGRYTGLVDDLQIYTHALSDEQITFLHANPGLTTVPEPAAGLMLFASSALLFRRRL